MKTKTILVSQVLKESGIEYHCNNKTESVKVSVDTIKTIKKTLDEMFSEFTFDPENIKIILGGPGPIWAFMIIQQYFWMKNINSLMLMNHNSSDDIEIFSRK